MINRSISTIIKKLENQYPVITILGPRQSGKTTLVKELYKDKEYVTFDDISIREIASRSPIDFIKAFPDGVVIDEAQKVPDIFDAIKYYADKDKKPGKYILTGSSQLKLKTNMSDSLAGRTAIIRLLPFSLDEVITSEQSDDPYDYILKGMYPPLYDKDSVKDKYYWFNNYIETYINQDVTELINAKNISEFKKFIKICAIHSGQILNVDNISRDMGVSAPTIKSWLSILESSYIIRLIQTDSVNIGKALIKSPKLYFSDSGLLCHLLNIESKEDLLLSKYKGHIVETFAISEIIKSRTNTGKNTDISYYRDVKKKEIDVILNWKKTKAIEIKSDSISKNNYTKEISDYVQKRENDNVEGAIFYLGDISCKINNIDYVSWKDWTSYLNNQ